jgi:excisionase family DNA binding protein
MSNPFDTIDARLSNIETLLLDIKHAPFISQLHTEVDQWFDIQGLCNYLPDKPTRPTVYGWVHFSVIPYHKGGKKLRFLKSEIDTWLKTGRRKTRVEIEAEADDFLNKSRKAKG